MLAIRDLTMSQKLITTGGRASPIAGVHVISRCLHISMHMELLPHYGHLSSAGIIHVMGYLVPCGGSLEVTGLMRMRMRVLCMSADECARIRD